MAEATHFAALDIVPMWARVNDELIELIDVLGEERLDWSPKPELWNTRGILLHILIGRNFLMERVIDDGGTTPDLLREAQSTAGLKEQLRRAWQRMAPFLSDRERLSREYDVQLQNAGARRMSGHWLAFGHLEHDIHHRADIYHYLGLLGIEHGEPDTVERSFKEIDG